MAKPMPERTVTERLLSVEEYLRLEEASEVKHEYIAGAVYAMVGASRRHNRIALNIASRLLAVAGEGPCRVYMADVKLRAAPGVLYYPDVMVACGPEGDPLIEEAPCLLVEVTSPGTEIVDRREKWAAYREIESLQTYLIVHQDERRVERYYRDERNEWRRAEVAGEGRLPLTCPEIELSLEEIYRGPDVTK